MKAQAVAAETVDSSNKWTIFILQNAGLLLGFTIVIVIICYGSLIDFE